MLVTPYDRPLSLHHKEFGRFVDKTWRKNVLMNPRFLDNEPPSGGEWVTHKNWDAQIIDILRTTILVRYLDGIDEVPKLVAAAASEFGVRYDPPEFQAHRGHCAAHLVVYPVARYRPYGGPDVEAELPVEIQVSTQLQEVVCELTHPIYEQKRALHPSDDELAWSEDPHFVSDHLPFALHLVDGVILKERRESKDRVKGIER
jgi:ppGpp synthetase/RelA/SpoT-type nucleotidyltranferase